ncbi:Fic family protein [Macrococcus capreoli]
MKYKATFQEEYLLTSNLLGAETIEELEQLEKVAFYIAEGLIEGEGFEFLFPLTIKSIKLLHKKLFGSIYSFAGEFREVSLMKDETRFCESQYININLKDLFDKFNSENEWSDIKIATERLAYFKTEIYMIHPFREGNGRTIRIIVREMARKKGFDWRTELLDRESYLNAMRKSSFDERPLIIIFENTLFPIH